ncbi:dUTP diphosphatase [Lutibacter sp.]|uniref:dUTP diphosphatase n=1 Tax=Lutibacter sp. TaxID=1925666 RepID=UPI0025BD22CF|nr:dUTP diphosphatase [Lutibacter sp.]
MTVYGNIPTKKNNNDAGVDLIADEDGLIKPNESKLIKTGTFVRFPPNHCGIVKARSGLSVKKNIEVGAGVIDEPYTGEIHVHLYNLSNTEEFRYKKGDRIAQLIIFPVSYPVIKVVKNIEDLGITDRGTDGFGSTGF